MIRVFTTLTAVLVSACAWSQADYESKSGFVDFDADSVFGDLSTTIEISLEGPLLSMLSSTMKELEPDLAQLLSKLDLIRVHVAPMTADAPGDSKDRVETLVSALEDKGWDSAMRIVQDGSTFVNALMKMKGDIVEGFVLFVLENSGQAVFVNIVGEFDPEKLGALAAKFMGDDFDASIFEDIAKGHEKTASPLDEARERATEAREAAGETDTDGAAFAAAESLWREAAALEKDGLDDAAKRLYDAAAATYSSLVSKP